MSLAITPSVNPSKKVKQQLNHTSIKLIPCEACAHKISPYATACPNCGHPVAIERTQEELCSVKEQELSESQEEELKCYACSRSATQKCSSCGAYSCAEHLELYIGGKRSRLLCNKCHKEAVSDDETFKVINILIVFIIIIVALAGGCSNY